MSIIDFNNKFEKVALPIEEIAERNAKQDNKYFVGKSFSLNHDEILKDGGKDFSSYKDQYKCIEVSIDWTTNDYFHMLQLDDNTTINFKENHLIVVGASSVAERRF